MNSSEDTQPERVFLWVPRVSAHRVTDSPESERYLTASSRYFGVCLFDVSF